MSTRHANHWTIGRVKDTKVSSVPLRACPLPNVNETLRTRRIGPSRRVFLPSAMACLLASLLVAATAVAGESAAAEEENLFDLSIEQLMEKEITSTATLTGTSARIAPAAITTITREQIQASGARSLFELLDIYVPNLQWIRQHWGPDNMGLRGIINDRDDKYLLLVNGRIINERTLFGALSERDLVMLSDIHHVDVIRGPGSALYGPGAVAMVINIVTYNAETFQGTEVTGRTGAIEEFYSAEIKHGQKFKDGEGGVFLYAGIAKYLGAPADQATQIFPNEFPTESVYSWWDPAWGTQPQPPAFPADGWPAGEPFTIGEMPRDHEQEGHLPPAKLYAQITRDGWDIWARYTRGGQQYVWHPGLLARDPYGWADWWSEFYNPNTGEFVSPMYPNSYRYQQATGYVGRTQDLTDKISLDYAVSYSMLDYSVFQANAVTNAGREDEYYGKLLARWQPAEPHRLAFGGEVSHRELGLDPVGWPGGGAVDSGSPRPQWSTNLYSLLGEHQWTINDQWTTFLGARLDRHTYTDWMFSPRAAIVHSPTDKDTLKLMWSRSVRANVENELKAQALAGIETSDPEVLNSVELRYERKQSERLDLAGSLFVHYDLEVISWDSGLQDVVPVGTQREYGLELEASYHTDKTRLQISHGYTKLYDFDLEPGQDTLLTAEPYGYGDDLAGWSNHITKITAQHKLEDHWTVDGSLRVYWGFPGLRDFDEYQADQTSYPLVSGDWKRAYRGNYFLNLGLQYQPTERLTVRLDGYNLLGIFDKDFNKRNYLGGAGDYRCEAVALGLTLIYRF